MYARPGSWNAWAAVSTSRRLQWYETEHAVTIDESCRDKWKILAAILPLVQRDRNLDVIAIPSDWLVGPDDFCVDVTAYQVDGRHGTYRLGDVTGVDSRVQACVASQPDAVYALLTVVLGIEFRGLSRCYLRCQGATHRSPALACLLCAIVYDRARLGLVTHRTQQAARDGGWMLNPY